MSVGRRTTLIALGAVALMVAAGACSSDDADPAADGTVGVTLQDFTVTLDPATVPAGEVTFDASNQGAEVHEFEIVKTDTPAGDFEITDDVADFGDGEIVDEVEDIAPGLGADLTVNLSAGRTRSCATSPGTTARACTPTSRWSSRPRLEADGDVGRPVTLFSATALHRLTCCFKGNGSPGAPTQELTGLNLAFIVRSGPARPRMDRETGPEEVARDRGLTGRDARQGTIAYGEGVIEPEGRRGPSSVSGVVAPDGRKHRSRVR